VNFAGSGLSQAVEKAQEALPYQERVGLQEWSSSEIALKSCFQRMGHHHCDDKKDYSMDRKDTTQ
jgi:hypothetical protein